MSSNHHGRFVRCLVFVLLFTDFRRCWNHSNQILRLSTRPQPRIGAKKVEGQSSIRSPKYTFASRVCGQHYDPSDDSGIEYEKSGIEPCTKIEVEVENDERFEKHLFFKFWLYANLRSICQS
jgi:hypothetical protein